ncbi:YheT family hydrolase [Leeuwenhoekiella sp. NPDC079379]|uniref:YheT family hydrolase n=1 Tax=Leeuwenhoekiella sp. NPDC079379 TaxID=3364122 RepID=UPI0037CB9DBE
MPLIESTYTAKGPFKNTHFNTIFAAKLRRVYGVKQKRERVVLSDGDFIDIDWSYSKNTETQSKTVLLFHGLEGTAKRTYMLGTVKQLIHNGYDCAAINLRSCSGEINTKLRSYHSGASEDVAEIISHINAIKETTQLYLCGFSLGGNLILKYLGENRERPDNIIAAVAISTPIDLFDSLGALEKRGNWVYRWSFLKDLRAKYKMKLLNFPEGLNAENYKKIKSLRLFDEYYTAPAHGFKNALDYYTKSSSSQFLKQIKVPVLLLNAKDDSFLNEKCYPVSVSKSHKFIHLEMPDRGGHVGFMTTKRTTYNEERTLAFFNTQIPKS